MGVPFGGAQYTNLSNASIIHIYVYMASGFPVLIKIFFQIGRF